MSPKLEVILAKNTTKSPSESLRLLFIAEEFDICEVSFISRHSRSGDALAPSIRAFLLLDVFCDIPFLHFL